MKQMFFSGVNLLLYWCDATILCWEVGIKTTQAKSEKREREEQLTIGVAATVTAAAWVLRRCPLGS